MEQAGCEHCADADRELRLECARLVAVFASGKGDMIALTDRLFRYIKEGGDD